MKFFSSLTLLFHLVCVQNMLKSAAQTQKQINLVKLHEQSKNNMEQEIMNYKEEAQKQRKIIYQLEKERDRYINEASDLTQKVFDYIITSGVDIGIYTPKISPSKLLWGKNDARMAVEHEY